MNAATASAVERTHAGPAIGIDLGGSKTEAVVLDAGGQEIWRHRIATPAAHYDDVLDALCALVQAAKREAGAPQASIGIGTPGSLTRAGLVKNANTLCLNGRPLQRDLEARLGQPLRITNDANCLALSEATEGAGAGAGVVFAAILGTGVGAGIAVNGQVLGGPNRLAGEWGHVPLPWGDADEARPACYCGQRGCIETLLSGPAMTADHAQVPALWERWVFSGGLREPVRTRLVPSLHGDSSGVRGAALLWRSAPGAGPPATSA